MKYIETYITIFAVLQIFTRDKFILVPALLQSDAITFIYLSLTKNAISEMQS